MTNTDLAVSPWGTTVAIDIATATDPTCERCHQPFQPRHGGGPKRRFCSSKCRTAFHNSKRFTETVERVTETADRISETVETFQATPKTAPTPPKEEPGFDWHRDREDIVVPEQNAIAIYRNPNNAVVIRQAGTYGFDEDVWIIINQENLVPIIAKLQRLERGEE